MLKEKILKFAKKTNNFSIDDLLITIEDSDINIIKTIELLISEGHIKRTNNTYSFSEKKYVANIYNNTNVLSEEIYNELCNLYLTPDAPALKTIYEQLKEKYSDFIRFPSLQTFSLKLKNDYSKSEIRSLRQKNNKIKRNRISDNSLFEEFKKTDMFFIQAANEFLENLRIKKGHNNKFIHSRHKITKHLIPFFTEMKLSEINKNALENFILIKKEEGFTQNSIKMYLNDLRNILKHQLNKQIDKDNINIFFETNNNNIQILDKESLEKILRTTKKYFNSVYPFLYTAASTGISMSELIVLKWKDIDFDNQVINIDKFFVEGRIKKYAKEPLKRKVDFSDKLAQILKELKNNSSKILDDLVFTEQNNALSPDRINIWLTALVKKSKIKKIGFNAFKCTYTAELITQNFPLNYIQKQLGYSSIDKLVELYEDIILKPDKLKIKKFYIIN